MDSSTGTPAAEVARAYVQAVEGEAQGRILPLISTRPRADVHASPGPPSST